MRFRKSEDPVKAAPFPGRDDVLDGYAALAAAEKAAGGVLLATTAQRDEGFPVPEPAPTFFDDAPAQAPASVHERGRVIAVQRDSDVPGLLTGFALEGERVSALVSNPEGLTSALATAAGKRLPLVLHVAARSGSQQAAASHGSHDAYHALADTGAFLMFAGNAQETADYAFIAHHIAERALTPGVCAQDRYATSHAVQGLKLPGGELADNYLGTPADAIASPGDAQSVVLGATRRRIPILLDPDRPAGIGSAQDADCHFRAVAAQRVFFSDALAATVDDSLHEFAALTGRGYERAVGYRIEDAEIVVAAQGAVIDALKPVVDFLRAERRIKAGVLNIAVLRPFPGAAASRMLAGKRVVTVLERTHAPLAEDPPLLRDIRAAADRAGENGRAHTRDLPYPDYAVYKRAEDRPALLSGIYGIGTSQPSFAQLLAVFENMTHDDMRRSFYLGAGFDVETRRFPHLQTLRQRLDREYPALARLSLEASASVTATGNDGALELNALSMQGALFAGNLFAQSLADATGWILRTWPDGGLEHNLQPARFGLSFRRQAGALPTAPESPDTTLVSGEHLIETIAARGALVREGTLVVGSVREPGDLWAGLSKRAADWIKAQSLALYVVDARKIGAETAAHASFIDQLSIWALLGAYTRVRLGLAPEQQQRIEDKLHARLDTAPGLEHATVAEIVRAFQRGAKECVPVAWREWLDVAHPLGEPDTPWTLRHTEGHDGSVFDAARFWHSVGYLYDRGQPALTLADPYLATAILPARSSAFRDMTSSRLHMPEWIAGNCTGCGNCWTQCPESALPATVRTLAAWIDAAVVACERTTGPLVQLKRMAGNLAKLGERVIAQGGPTPYETLPAILTAAFARLLDKSALEGDRLVALRAEFERLLAAAEGLALAAAEPFFNGNGTGQLLSIALNPLSCTACGICITECADGALEWAAQTPDRLAAARRSWDFLMALPPADVGTIASLTHADESATQVNRLLDPAVYHTMVGGDGSLPGSGARTALHLVTASIESVMRPRFAAHTERLAALIEKIEASIHSGIHAGIRVNDFDEFSRRLQRLERKDLNAAQLLEALGETRDAPAVDTTRLARLTGILHDLKVQHAAYSTASDGTGRARMVIVVDPSRDGTPGGGTYPYNPFAQPWASNRAGDAIALARAVTDTLARRVAAEAAVCRRAELELQNASDVVTGTQPAGWADLTEAERWLVPRVLVTGHADTITTPAAWDVLSGDLPISIVAIDAAGLPVPAGPEALAGGRGVAATRAAVPAGCFLARTSIGVPGHLMAAVVDSLAAHRPALLRVHAPDPVTCGVAPERVSRLARAAVESRAVPVYVVGRDAPVHVDLNGNPDLAADWTTHQLAVSDASGTPSTLDTDLTVADWALQQARFRAHFRVMSRGHRNDRTRPLSAFLALAPDAREGLQPYIDVRDSAGRHAIALVSRELARMAEQARRDWRELRGASESRQAPVTAAATPVAPAASATAPDPAALGVLTENLLRLCGFGSDDPFFKRSLRDFVARERSNGDDGE